MQRLCSAHGIASVLARKQGRGLKPGPAVHDDLVQREFSVDAPNKLWFADITEHPTAEGKLYLCAVKDAFSGRIVGYSIESRMKASLAVAALRHAIVLCSPLDTIVHSDRGSQFRSKKFVRMLRNNGLIGSMGRVGACQDNAATARSRAQKDFDNHVAVVDAHSPCRSAGTLSEAARRYCGILPSAIVNFRHMHGPYCVGPGSRSRVLRPGDWEEIRRPARRCARYFWWWRHRPRPARRP